MGKNSALDMCSKQEYKKRNLVDFWSTKCVICNFNIALATTNGPFSEDMTYYNSIIQKEHHFLQNIFDSDELKLSKNMKKNRGLFCCFR